MIKRLFHLSYITVFLLCAGVAHAQDVTFFSTLGDVPVMAGLIELNDEGFTFDKPEGRVVEVVAYSAHTNHLDVLEYYTKTLPQFGWTPEESHSFTRAHERLDLKISKENSAARVYFVLSPL